MEEDKEKNSGFSFMQEKIKEKPVYANPLVKKALRCILGGALFGGTALLIWAGNSDSRGDGRFRDRR